jgi:hypothetical protein
LCFMVQKLPRAANKYYLLLSKQGFSSGSFDLF